MTFFFFASVNNYLFLWMATSRLHREVRGTPNVRAALLFDIPPMTAVIAFSNISGL